MACPTKLIFNLLSFAPVHSRSECLSGEKPGLWAFHLRLPTPLHFKVLGAHLEITDSASQMENKRDTLCFEEIDPRRWQAGCQPVWLWYCYGFRQAAFFFLFFFYPFVKAILLDLLLRVNNLRPRCWHCADVFFSGCHVTQKRRGCRQ